MKSVEYHQKSLMALKHRAEDNDDDHEAHEFQKFQPTAQQWKLISGATELLEPVKRATKVLQAEKVPTITNVVEQIIDIRDSFDDFIKDKKNKGSGVMFARALKPVSKS